MQSSATLSPHMVKAEIRLKHNERDAEPRKIVRLRLKLKELQKRRAA